MNADFPQTAPSVGERYALVHKVGEGSTGEVWEAVHRGLNRKVAIKLLKPECLDRGNARRRFLAEANALALIDSSWVVSVSDLGETPAGVPFMVMEFLNGSTLRDIIAAGGALAPLRAVRLSIAAGAGVAAVHAAGFVHRDLKPENLFVTQRDNEGESCKVLDLGLAKHEAGENLTRDGAIVGTVRYMAPEQARGQIADARTDVHALGLVLYEMLTGRPLFNEKSEHAQLFRIMNPEPAILDFHGVAIPAPLTGILARALAPNPEARWSTAAEWLEALRHALESGQLAADSLLLPWSRGQLQAGALHRTEVEDETPEQLAERRQLPVSSQSSAEAWPLRPTRTKVLPLGLGLVGLGALSLLLGWDLFKLHAPEEAAPRAGQVSDVVGGSTRGEPAREKAELSPVAPSAVPAASVLLPEQANATPKLTVRRLRSPVSSGAKSTSTRQGAAVDPAQLSEAKQVPKSERPASQLSPAKRLRYAEENPYEGAL